MVLILYVPGYVMRANGGCQTPCLVISACAVAETALASIIGLAVCASPSQRRVRAMLVPTPLVAAQLDGAAPPAYTHRAQNITIGAWERLASSESPTVFSEDSSPLGQLVRLSKGGVEGATCGIQ